MDWPFALGGALVLLALSTGLGLLYKRRTGRAHTVAPSTSPSIVHAADLGVDVAAFGGRATLVQFSTEFCGACPQTRRLLADVAAASTGVTTVDVDLGDRPDLAKRFRVMQTPTVLLLDSTGIVRSRIGGAPQRRTLTEQLELLLAKDPHVAALN